MKKTIHLEEFQKNKDLLEKENKNEKIEEQTMPTTDDIENPKLKWDDFVNNDEEDEEESNNIKRKNKRGKRFYKLKAYEKT